MKCLFIFQNNFLMKKKTTLKTDTITHQQASKMLKSLSLSELSISQIQQKRHNQDSVDFQQQRDLISQIIPKTSQFTNEYGLKLFLKKPYLGNSSENKNRVKQKRSKDLCDKNNIYQCKDYERQLRFDHEIKRKKSFRKTYSEEISQQIGIIKGRTKISDPQKTIKKNKQISQNKITINTDLPKPLLSKFFKRTHISTNLHEKQIKSKINFRIQDNCPELYHLRPDEMKQQISDINPNLGLNKSPFEEVHSSRNKSISLANSLNSCQSVQDLRGSLNSGNNSVKDKGKIKLIQNCYYRQGVKSTKESQIHEVKRPISLDHKIQKVKSFYSNNILAKDSPLSRDSNRSDKTTKRSNIIINGRNKVQSFFISERPTQIFLQRQIF